MEQGNQIKENRRRVRGKRSRRKGKKWLEQIREEKKLDLTKLIRLFIYKKNKKN